VAAFATGVPPDLYAFHHYTGNSTTLYRPPALPYCRTSPRWAGSFHRQRTGPPARALRPV